LASSPSGSVNSSNKIYTLDHKPLADNNYDDTIDASDVTAYVNGTSVSVTSVNATTGAVTFATAPTTGTAVTIDHSYSSVSTDYVAETIEEAEEWVTDELAEVMMITTVPKQVRMLTRLYAAGLLMIRFYGLQNSEDQVDSGYAKLKLAKALMADYRNRQVANGEDVGTVAVPLTNTRTRLFQKYDETNHRWNQLDDENFTANRET
jgi:hypothetical protein